jgi:hypothetical protein
MPILLKKNKFLVFLLQKFEFKLFFNKSFPLENSVSGHHNKKPHGNSRSCRRDPDFSNHRRFIKHIVHTLLINAQIAMLLTNYVLIEIHAFVQVGLIFLVYSEACLKPKIVQ